MDLLEKPCLTVSGAARRRLQRCQNKGIKSSLSLSVCSPVTNRYLNADAIMQPTIFHKGRPGNHKHSYDE